MIVTRSWLEEFIDLKGIDDTTLHDTLNTIGLEVERMERFTIPENVVVGKVLSCDKHPDADKLNVCRIDVGSKTLQIVCGAANVVDAEYVAVAINGAVLPGNFEIRHTKLRGVESEGMVCSATEIGLPKTEEGIMILDDSIGALEIGRELGSYPNVSDTVFEIELTANRGDCLSVYGVARDLSAALNRELKTFDFKINDTLKLGIGRKAELHTKGKVDCDIVYKLAKSERIDVPFLMRLRLGFADIETQSRFEAYSRYAMHATGVVLRMYDCKGICRQNEKNVVEIEHIKDGINQVHINGNLLSVVGVYQKEDGIPETAGDEVLIEASYIEPDLLSEATAQDKTIQKDSLYYFTSRGTNPDLHFGLHYLGRLFEAYAQIECYEGELFTETERDVKKIRIEADTIEHIVGMRIETGKIAKILQRLGFEVTPVNEHEIVCKVPLYRHDIHNIYDVTEEIIRMVGIDNIPPKPLSFTEQDRQNETYLRYRNKSKLRQRAVAQGFFEAVTYLFADKHTLRRYNFTTLDEDLDLSNPIIDEFNTLRSTLIVNLLQATKRNVNYGKRRIALFEIGSVFDEKRRQKEVVAFVYSGQKEYETVDNSGKPENINFHAFVDKLSGVIGPFELRPCTVRNGLIHPYQSADVFIDAQKVGYVAKLHLGVQEELSLNDTYIAEFSFDALVPKHKNALTISNYQGVYKDLSIVIKRSINYGEVRKAIEALREPLLRRFYPIDLYYDETLGDHHSLTLRFFIQSNEKTLEDTDIESVMQRILQTLQNQFKATLR